MATTRIAPQAVVEVHTDNGGRIAGVLVGPLFPAYRGGDRKPYVRRVGECGADSVLGTVTIDTGAALVTIDGYRITSLQEVTS